MDELRSRVRGEIAEQFGLDASRLPDPLDADSVAAWDSLGHLSLMNGIEKAFGVRIPPAEAVELWNETAIVEAIARRRPAGV